MEERRKHKRMPLDAKIIAKGIKDNGREEISVNIEVFDVSKTGIGFNCPDLLEIGALYEATVTLWTQEHMHVFVQIVRIELKPEHFVYGGIFIGMPEADLQRIKVYEMIHDAEEQHLI